MGNSPSTGIRSYQNEKPKDYTLKIQNFSRLKSAVCTGKTYNRYESKIFNASGYKWKLALYPNGDRPHFLKKGWNHISLYLVTVEDDILSAKSELDVRFTFLIYNSKTDKFLAIQDGKIRRFHAMKTEWGFEKLMSLPKFNNASNGFLANDCCVLGVDIAVVVMNPNEWKGEVLSLLKQPTNHKFTWKVSDFSNLKNKYYESNIFKVESYDWKIRLYPRGNSKEGFLSLFLQLHNFEELPRGFRVYVEYEIAVSNQLGYEARKFVKHWFEDNGFRGWGVSKFLSLKCLEEPRNGFLHNNDMMVEAKINSISTLKIECF